MPLLGRCGALLYEIPSRRFEIYQKDQFNYRT